MTVLRVGIILGMVYPIMVIVLMIAASTHVVFQTSSPKGVIIGVLWGSFVTCKMAYKSAKEYWVSYREEFPKAVCN